MLFHLCEMLESAKLIYNDIKQINGCLVLWEGKLTTKGHKETSVFVNTHSTVHLKWIHSVVCKIFSTKEPKVTTML